MFGGRRDVEIEAIYEFSPMQLGMLFQSLLSPTSGVFIEQQVLPIGRGFDRRGFERALHCLVEGTPVLRTSFHWRDLDRPVQVVHRDVTIPIESLDWSHEPPRVQARMLDEHLVAMRCRGVDFECPPLMQVTFVRVAPASTWFIWQFHHILLDGWSGQLVLKDLVHLYEVATTGGELSPPVRPPYSLFIDWLRQQDAAANERFWRQRLRGLTAPTPLGVGRTDVGGQRQAGNELRVEREIPEQSATMLREFARRNRLTMNTLVQGAWALLLSRYSGADDVTYGTVLSGRPAGLPGVEEMVGLFINTIPQRVHIDLDESGISFLSRLQGETLETQAHQHVSTMELQRWSELPPRTKLFDSVLVFENFPLASANGERGPEPMYLGRTDVAITLMVVPGTTMRLKFVVDDRVVDEASTGRMAMHLQIVLEALASRPGDPLRAVPMMDDDERHRILVELNDTAIDGYAAKSLATLLEDQARRTPDRVAFTDESGRSTTFELLDERSNRLANLLVDMGIVPGAVVGVHLPRSIDAATAFLAILKARATYLPLDSRYPRQRLAYMVRTASAELVISSSELAIDIDVAVLDLDLAEPQLALRSTTCPQPHAAPDDAAYVLFTSGSTGQPKGVVVEHRQILNRLHWMWREYPFAAHEVGVMRTSLNFVDSFWELLGPLLRGVPSVIASDELMQDPEAFIAFLAEHRVTRLWLVPSYLQMLLDVNPDLGRAVPALRFWSVGGEALTRRLYDDFCHAAPDATLYNVYGGSEFWDATVFDPAVDVLPPEGMTVGRPIANTQIYILDHRGEVVPVGVAGTLYVGGACLARGYVDDELTSERFVPNPIPDQPGDRLYDTGDIARYRADGTIELIGRRDEQINLRGFRVEPAEVEFAIEASPAVRQAAVVARRFGPDDDRLVAYVVPAGDERDADRLLVELAQRLPFHLIPSAIVWIDAMPSTTSGKRDRLSLPPFEPPSPEPSAGSRPRNRREQTVVGLMAELLGVSTVGIHDNFFLDLGGHSLLATRLVSRLRREFGVDVPVRTVFDRPTAAQLTEVLPPDDDDDLDDETLRLLEDIETMSSDEIDSLLAALELDPDGES
jgi:surfactin family lipopeptide synthetase C